MSAHSQEEWTLFFNYITMPVQFALLPVIGVLNGQRNINWIDAYRPAAFQAAYLDIVEALGSGDGGDGARI